MTAEPDAYPLLSHASADGMITYSAPAPSDRTALVTLERRSDPTDEPEALDQFASELWDAATDGGCVAWIHNTVDGAQQAFRALRRTADVRTGKDVKLVLFHARFLLRDRQRIEAEVGALFGTAETGRSGPSWLPRKWSSRAWTWISITW